jgi:hypothetical protein
MVELPAVKGAGGGGVGPSSATIALPHSTDVVHTVVGTKMYISALL